jgi:recombination protein RecA
MLSANAIRVQVEASLSNRIPSALSPAPKLLRLTSSTGISAIDDVLEGGLPLGALTEMVGPECSGRTSLALTFLAQLTQVGKVCAWIDVSNSLRPESVAAAGIDLSYLLWVRCGVSQNSKAPVRSEKIFTLPEKYMIAPPKKRGLHGGGFGPHPRNEQKGLSHAVSNLFPPNAVAPRCVEPQGRIARDPERFEPAVISMRKPQEVAATPTPWSRLEQALKAADLLLHGGGFSAIVLDMGSIAPTFATRVPLATWFRYRAAAERSQASILLLSQHACAKSSAELVLQMESEDARCDEQTVFTGLRHRIEVQRQRFAEPSNVLPMKKPGQRAHGASWKSQSVAWIAMWRRYLSAIWRKRSYIPVQPCPMTRLSLAAVTISLDTISD